MIQSDDLFMNNALQAELTKLKSQYEQVLSELNSQKENCAKELESITSNLSNHQGEDYELDLKDIKAERDYLMAELHRLKNSLNEMHQSNISIINSSITSSQSSLTTFQMFEETFKSYQDYKKSTEEKLQNYNVIISSLCKMFECNENSILSKAQQMKYKIHEIHRLSTLLGEAEGRCISYSRENERLKKELNSIRETTPSSVQTITHELAAHFSDRAKMFDSRMTTSIGSLRDALLETSLRFSSVKKSLIDSPALQRPRSPQTIQSPRLHSVLKTPSSTYGKSNNSIILSGTKRINRSPLSSRTIVDSDSIRTPSIYRSTPILNLDARDFD